MKQAKEDIENGFPVWKALEETNILRHILLLCFILEKNRDGFPKNLKMVALNSRSRGFLSQSSLFSRLSAYCFVTFFLLESAFRGLFFLDFQWYLRNLKLIFPLWAFYSIWVFLGKYGSIVVPLFLLFFFQVCTLCFPPKHKIYRSVDSFENSLLFINSSNKQNFLDWAT